MATVYQRGGKWFAKVRLDGPEIPAAAAAGLALNGNRVEGLPIRAATSGADAADRIDRAIDGARAVGTEYLVKVLLQMRTSLAPRKPAAPTSQPASGGPITVRQWGEQWTGGKLAKYDIRPTGSTEESTLRLHVYPVQTRGERGPAFGDLPLAGPDRVTEQDCMALVGHWHLGKAKRWTLRRWFGTTARLFTLAIYPGKHITSSPMPRQAKPRTSAPPLASFLLPEEFLAMEACTETVIDLRVFAAIAVYTDQRKSSIYGLLWSDLQTHDGITILTVRHHKTVRTRGPLVFPLKHGLAELLAKWRAYTGAGPNDPIVRRGRVSRDWHEGIDIRAALLRAGVAAARLHNPTNDPAIQTFDEHGLRRTGISWEVKAGLPSGTIRQEAGHTSDDMTALYTGLVGAYNFTPFPDVRNAIPELADNGLRLVRAA